MKTYLCLVLLAASQLCLPAQEMLGGKTEGGGPDGAPATNRPCWRYPIRVINYRKFDLHPLFAWWRENYGAYQSVVAAAAQAQEPPDFSKLPPSPMPGWHRIKQGHFISNAAYGWLCEVVIEDVPSHAVTNKIIIRDPPLADQAAWTALVARYDELKEEGPSVTTGANPAPKHHSHKAAYAAANPPPDAQNPTPAATPSGTNSPAHHHHSALESATAALDKFPEGTNYTIDLFAVKLGYLQDGSHRQVYDLGQMYVK